MITTKHFHIHPAHFPNYLRIEVPPLRGIFVKDVGELPEEDMDQYVTEYAKQFREYITARRVMLMEKV